MAQFEPKLMQKKSFIRSKENITASFDWTDVADGTGIVEFDAWSRVSRLVVAGANTTAVTFHLSKKPVWWGNYPYMYALPSDFALSTVIDRFFVAGAAAIAGTSVEIINKDFNLSAVNTPKVVRGTCYVDLPVSLRSKALTTSGDNIIFEIVVTLKNATTSATIGTATWSFRNTYSTWTTVVNAQDGMMVSFALPCTKTVIAAGEVLALNITINGTNEVDTDTLYALIGLDPNNDDIHWRLLTDTATYLKILPTTNEYVTTSLKVQVPFQIDN